MSTTLHIVSDKYLARTFHALPHVMTERLTSLGIEPVEIRDGVRYYAATVVDQLREREQNKTD